MALSLDQNGARGGVAGGIDQNHGAHQTTILKALNGQGLLEAQFDDAYFIDIQMIGLEWRQTLDVQAMNDD